MFTDESSHSPTAWVWSFGDGATSTEQNPTHIFSSPGLYTVSFTAVNAGGANTDSKTINVNAAPTQQVIYVTPPPTTTPTATTKPWVAHTVGVEVKRTITGSIQIKTISGDVSLLNAIYLYVNNEYYMYTPSSSNGSPGTIGSTTTFEVSQNTNIQVIGDFSDGYAVLFAGTI
jgi:PKD repeat protein